MNHRVKGVNTGVLVGSLGHNEHRSRQEGLTFGSFLQEKTGSDLAPTEHVLGGEMVGCPVS